MVNAGFCSRPTPPSTTFILACTFFRISFDFPILHSDRGAADLRGYRCIDSACIFVLARLKSVFLSASLSPIRAGLSTSLSFFRLSLLFVLATNCCGLSACGHYYLFLIPVISIISIISISFIHFQLGLAACCGHAEGIVTLSRSRQLCS